MLILDSCPLDGLSGHDAALNLLKRMYRQETGRSLPEILRTPRGKPYFPGSDLHFSISHTPVFAFCALSDRPVGIDAEEITRRVDLRLAQKILSPGELAIFNRARDQNETLLRFWVLKEAQAKCSGQGLRGYPNHTDFRPDDPRIRVLSGCFVAVITEGVC